MSQWVLVFIMNIEYVSTWKLWRPEPVNYCTGWYLPNDDTVNMSCLTMDGKVDNFNVRWRKESA